MISEELIQKAKEFACGEIKKYELPIMSAFDLSNQKGQELADKLNANKDIVLLGTILMDCMLGYAKKEGKIQDHVRICYDATEKFLQQFSELEDQEKENILYCVQEHHGTEKFYSIESEICCNSDCYRFLSIKGIIGTIREIPNLTIEEIVDLCLKKVEEKHNLLSLDVAKQELDPQYSIIQKFLKHEG